MGSSLGWTDDDRVPLCEAYLVVSTDAVHGTSRSKDDLWAAVHKAWEDKIHKKGPMRVERNASALEKQFKRIRTGVSTFTSHYLAVKAMPTTGNLTEEDIISGAVARYCWLDVYDAIRTDREKDKRQDSTRKRKAKLAHCKWVACWRVLRQSDKFSGAANLAISGTDVDTTSEDETGSWSGGGVNKSNGGFQRRPGGVKAVKAARLEDMQYEKQVQASTDALAKLTAAQHERTALCFFESPSMRNTPEAARYRQAVVNKMLQSAGVSVGSTSSAGGAAGVDESVDGLNGGVAGLGVRDSSLTTPPDASPAAGAPAPPARGAPAAPGTAAAAAVSAPAARAVTGAAERPGQRASVAGRKAQASKEQAAKEVLVRKLRTTHDLDDSDEGSTTDSTEAV